MVDVEEASLQGKFDNDKVMYISIPDVIEKFYCRHDDFVLHLNVPVY